MEKSVLTNHFNHNNYEYQSFDNSQIKTFIDIFSGIGGFHLSLSSLGLKCVYASEIDKYARETYKTNFKTDFEFNDDITEANIDSIPKHDILCAGFPCQPFSQAGFKKGFADKRNLFTYIIKIIEKKKPKILMLENVRHLLNHNNGKTFEFIKLAISKLNYDVHFQVLKASDFNLPQHRPRLYIICFDKKVHFTFPKKKRLHLTLSKLFGGECKKDIGYTLRVGGRGSGLHDRRNWDAYLVNNKEIRIGKREALKLMGFPASFQMPCSNTQSMKQLGNSVAIPVITSIAQNLLTQYE